MTAHDHQIRQPRLRADQCHVGGGTRIECGRKRVDRQKTIRLRESRNRSRALAGRKRSQAVIARGQSDEHEFLAAEFGRNANRNARIRYDKKLYRERNWIERVIGHLKINRAVATRYDQLAETFLGMLNLATARYWIKFVHTA